MSRNNTDGRGGASELQLMSSDTQWTLLARILRPQGRHGEVLADLFTDFAARFTSQPDVWLAPQGFTGLDSIRQSEQSEPEAARVSGQWLPVGRNAGRIVLQIAGIDTISAAERLSGKEVVIPAQARMPLEDGAAYISDLVGCTVYDGGHPVGVVQDVEFATTADGSRRLEEAAPLLVVTGTDGAEILIPFAKEFLIEVDTGSKAVRMQLPQGLTQVNARESE